MSRRGRGSTSWSWAAVPPARPCPQWWPSVGTGCCFWRSRSFRGIRSGTRPASGVHLATYGALLAGRSINSVLDGSLDEVRSLGEFEARYRREYGLFYEFLVSFYDMQRDERSYFWSAKKVSGVAAPEAEAFAKLVGGLVSGDTAIVTADAVGSRLAAVATDSPRR